MGDPSCATCRGFTDAMVAPVEPVAMSQRCIAVMDDD